MSVLVPAPDDGRGWVPLVAGLAVQRGVADVTGLGTSLKWPNDVLLAADGDRKVSGILCELQPRGIVVGIGVNVSQSREELPVDTATSLRIAGADDVRREDLAVAVLDHLASLHADLVAGGPAREAAQAAYRDACSTLGRTVDLHTAAGAVTRVRGVGVDGEGRLVVATDGAEYAVAAGDVSHVRPADEPG
jgi:BirA family biotin operon repressor/biotin-[acetyl-CoA-carboxylase] ligase